jgi:hypothetical protein
MQASQGRVRHHLFQPHHSLPAWRIACLPWIALILLPLTRGVLVAGFAVTVSLRREILADAIGMVGVLQAGAATGGHTL